MTAILWQVKRFDTLVTKCRVKAPCKAKLNRGPNGVRMTLSARIRATPLLGYYQEHTFDAMFLVSPQPMLNRKQVSHTVKEAPAQLLRV